MSVIFYKDNYYEIASLRSHELVVTDLVVSSLFMAAGGCIAGLILGTGNKG